MAYVKIEQRNGRLAADVKLEQVSGREGPLAKASVVVISNVVRNETSEATSIRWTVWGRQAENAAKYLTKGSRVNVVGTLMNNNYERNGETVYAFNFSANEIDYLDGRKDSAESPAAPLQAPPATRKAKGKAAKASKAPATVGADDDIPF